MKTKLLISCIIYVSFLFVLLPSNTQAKVNQKLDFNNVSDKYLFDLSNMKPGDWATRNLEIHNQFDKDFKYNTKVYFKDGFKDLYKEFELTVWDADGVELYSGKLYKFEGFNPRFLASGDKEILTFEATFPFELGNEFQGKYFEFELRFIIEDNTSSPGPGPNPKPIPNPDPKPKPSPDPKPEPDPDPSLNPDPEPKPEPNPNPDADQDPDPDNDTMPPDPNPDQDEDDIPESDSDGNDPEGEPDQDVDTELDFEEGTYKDEISNLPVDGHILPATATNIFNLIIIGAIILFGGIGLYIFQRKKQRAE